MGVKSLADRCGSHTRVKPRLPIYRSPRNSSVTHTSRQQRGRLPSMTLTGLADGLISPPLIDVIADIGQSTQFIGSQVNNHVSAKYHERAARHLYSPFAEN